MAVTEFQQAVFRIVSTIPRGKVMSYGQVARRLGKPGAARGVGAALGALPEDFRVGRKVVPWWRVVNGRGEITTSPIHRTSLIQRALLEGERVRFDGDLRVEAGCFVRDRSGESPEHGDDIGDPRSAPRGRPVSSTLPRVTGRP
jgi:methylated-DNA-protein-cysteine methyltransferase related protein